MKGERRRAQGERRGNKERWQGSSGISYLRRQSEILFPRAPPCSPCAPSSASSRIAATDAATESMRPSLPFLEQLRLLCTRQRLRDVHGAEVNRRGSLGDFSSGATALQKFR